MSAIATLMAASSVAAQSVFYVDRSDPACSNSGPGSSSTPYCTIGKALSVRGAPGVTIMVRTGTYREQVTLPASGTSGNPLVIKADGSPVVVDGADDFSSLAAWTQVSGDVWLASQVTWNPQQVFADGARLTPSTGPPAALGPRSFVFDPAVGLYVNAGGGNPGAHQTQVGHRSYGFSLSARSWVTIDGFAVLHSEKIGILLADSCRNVSILNNTISLANNFGLRAIGGSGFLIASNRVSYNNDHGIYLTIGVTGSLIRGNEAFGNARPNVRAANGIQLFGSLGNRIEGNLLHDNQDTGLQLNNGSDDNVSIQNRSWHNGDHGYDHLHSTGNLHVGDVAWGNYKDGFSIEGDASGTKVFDCIAVDNGLTTNEFDLWVDLASSVGFQSNDNIFWNSTSQAPVKFITTLYPTLAGYVAASGLDQRSIQADPRFVDPAAGDFHLRPGSPAIDSGNSSVPDWPSTDAEGHPRVDDPATANTGVGTIRYADRGALEYVPLVVAGVELCPNPSFEVSTDGWRTYGNSVTLSRVAGGHAGGYAAELYSTKSGNFGIDDSPDIVGVTPSAGVLYRYTAWVRSAAGKGQAWLQVREFNNGRQQGSTDASPKRTLSPTWQQLVVEHDVRVAGSSLDFQVLYKPKKNKETFQTDDISVQIVGGAPVAGVGAGADGTPPGGDVLGAGTRFAAAMVPNPTNAHGRFFFATTRSGPVRLQVFDVSGREVARPLDQATIPAGVHQVSAGTGADRLPAGLYFYRLAAAEGTLTGRFAVLK